MTLGMVSQVYVMKSEDIKVLVTVVIDKKRSSVSTKSAICSVVHYTQNLWHSKLLIVLLHTFSSCLTFLSSVSSRCIIALELRESSVRCGVQVMAFNYTHTV